MLDTSFLSLQIKLLELCRAATSLVLSLRTSWNPRIGPILAMDHSQRLTPLPDGRGHSSDGHQRLCELVQKLTGVLLLAERQGEKTGYLPLL
jgi:hypothetical protein